MKKLFKASINPLLLFINISAQVNLCKPRYIPMNGVFFTDINNGIAVDEFNTILKTIDGWINWAPQSSFEWIDLYGVSFIDSNTKIIHTQPKFSLYPVFQNQQSKL